MGQFKTLSSPIIRCEIKYMENGVIKRFESERTFSNLLQRTGVKIE